MSNFDLDWTNSVCQGFRYYLMHEINFKPKDKLNFLTLTFPQMSCKRGENPLCCQSSYCFLWLDEALVSMVMSEVKPKDLGDRP